jgi:hypothetical protein
MTTGWIQLSGVYYYLDPSTGKMAANTTLTIDGKSYSFASNGAYQNGSSGTPTGSSSSNIPGGTDSNSNAPGSSSTTTNSGGPGGSSTGANNLTSPPTSQSNDTPGGTSNSSGSGTYQLSPGLTSGPG